MVCVWQAALKLHEFRASTIPLSHAQRKIHLGLKDRSTRDQADLEGHLCSRDRSAVDLRPVCLKLGYGISHVSQKIMPAIVGHVA